MMKMSKLLEPLGARAIAAVLIAVLLSETLWSKRFFLIRLILLAVASYVIGYLIVFTLIRYDL